MVLSVYLHAMSRYAVSELQNDVEKELLNLPEAEREAQRTKFAVFVVHNKRKAKLGTLPPDLPYVPVHESVHMVDHFAITMQILRRCRGRRRVVRVSPPCAVRRVRVC